jgi:hypothetical protein
MNPERRKHKRIAPPKGTIAAWKSAGKSAVSRVQDIGLGGVFLITPNAPASGASVDLLLSLPIGEVRARAMVCRSIPEKGMGLKFVQMAAHDRARLNQFVLNTISAPPSAPQHAATVSSPTPKPPTGIFAAPPEAHQEPFEKELAAIAELSRKGTYYQLLGVTHDSPADEIKHNYYALAKKFHPDLHMDKPHLLAPLKDLTAKVSAAYQTLRDPGARKSYDQKLDSSGALNFGRSKNESQETIEYCALQAREYIRGGNFVGSITWLRKCIALAPENAGYHAMLARSLATVRGYQSEAIEHFERAIQLDPWNVDAYFYFGELYERLKLPWRAQPLFAKILEIDPENFRARGKLTAAGSFDPRQPTGPTRSAASA